MWDKQNLFSDQQTLAAADSDDIVKVGPPDAGKGEPVNLVASVSPGSTGPLTIAVKTSDAADMTGASTLAEFFVPADKMARGGDVLNAYLPTGCKNYLRLAYSGGSGGTITAGLSWGGQTNGI